MTQTSKVTGVATTVYTDEDGSLCVKYHNTTVWRKRPDGSVMLNAGGWKTATTKNRMNQAFNQFGPAYYSVFQKRGDWFVWIRGTKTDIPFEDDALELPRVIEQPTMDDAFYAGLRAAKPCGGPKS